MLIEGAGERLEGSNPESSHQPDRGWDEGRGNGAKNMRFYGVVDILGVLADGKNSL